MCCNLLLLFDAYKDEKSFSTCQTSKSVVIHHEITRHIVKYTILKLSASSRESCIQTNQVTQSTTQLNMSEYGYSLTRIFPYKDRIVRQKKGQRKPVFWHILRSVR